MGVTECKLMRSTTANYDARGRGRYEHEYRITTDSTDQALTVYAGALTAAPDPLPREYSVYNVDGDTDAGAFRTDLRLTRHNDDAKVWTARCTWGPLEGNESPDDHVINPLIRPVKYHLESWTRTEIVRRDASGQPIVNSVGDWFEDPLEEDVEYPVLVAIRNFHTLAEVITLVLTYQNKVSSAEFKGAPAGTMRCTIRCGQQMIEDGVEYYPVAFRFAINPDGWHHLVLDRGWRARPALGEEPEVVLDAKTKQRPPRPVLLTADGLEAPAGTFHYLTFNKETADFNNIGV